MNQPALKLVENELIPFGIEELTRSNIDLMEKQILDIPKVPEDAKQYNTVRDMHIDAKKLLPRIEERRKELKAPVLEKAKEIDATAKKAVAMVQPLIDMSAERRFAWEAIKEKEIAEKERIETERLAGIDAAMKHLEALCSYGLQYGLPADELSDHFEKLSATTIEEDIFQERSGEAKARLESGIIGTKQALDARIKFEQEQAELKAAQEAQAKAEAEAKAKRDAEEKARAEAQAKLDAERKAFEAEQAKAKIEAQRLADIEAEKQRKEAEKIQAERQALEDEKARILAEEKAMKDAELLRLEIAKAHGEAISLNAEFDHQKAEEARILAEHIEAEAKAINERLEAMKPDKERMKDYVLRIGDLEAPLMTTDDGKSWLREVENRLRSAVDCAMQFVNA